jgi:hypothetical protein
MGPRLFTVVAMVTLRAAAMHAVIYGIRIGEAVGSIVAVTEGHDRWRGHEAKGGEGGDCHCHSEAKPSAECPHYETSLVGWGAPRKPRERRIPDRKGRSSPPREDINTQTANFRFWLTHIGH